MSQIPYQHGEGRHEIPVLEELPVGIIIADRGCKLTVFNHEAERILRIGAQPVGPSRWSEVYGCQGPDRVTVFHANNLPAQSGLEVKQLFSTSGRGKNIFLDIPLDRTGDCTVTG